ncbi:MAG: hypothetical protein FJ264_17345 [Planctomycetes bacterium]|nr:hypothetical protein [Planctomycetota bacterium]
MTIINTLDIYEDLKSQFKEEEARTLTKALEKSLEEYQKKQESFLATKDDIANMRTELKEDINKVRLATKDDITNLRTEVKEDINKVRNKLANAKAEIIKWLFIFLVGQGISIIGILKFIK